MSSNSSLTLPPQKANFAKCQLIVSVCLALSYRARLSFLFLSALTSFVMLTLQKLCFYFDSMIPFINFYIGLWRELWKALLNHLQAASLQWNSEKVLQTNRKSLQWWGAGGVSNSLWVFLHNKICGEAARKICWRHILWEASNWDLWGWMHIWRGGWGMSWQSKYRLFD